jgi:hypothetical protein
MSSSRLAAWVAYASGVPVSASRRNDLFWSVAETKKWNSKAKVRARQHALASTRGARTRAGRLCPAPNLHLHAT